MNARADAAASLPFIGCAQAPPAASTTSNIVTFRIATSIAVACDHTPTVGGSAILCLLVAALVDTVSTVVRRAAPGGAAWLDDQLASVAQRFDANGFAVAFSAAGRRLGTAAVTLGDDERARLGEQAPILDGRGADELGRVALLLAAATTTDVAALAAELFYRGEMREKQAVLRALPLLPESAALVDIGIEACRSSVQTVFDAIACENPFPAARFSEPAFNQMVLKALFTETPVARIIGLPA